VTVVRPVLAALLLLALAVPVRAQPEIVAVEPVGTFHSNAPGWGRDAGFSARVGAEILWVFGDTFLPGGRMWSATAAWSKPSSPLTLREPVDERGMPYQFYPFTHEESAFATAHANRPHCCGETGGCPKGKPYCRCTVGTDCAVRYALWPGSVIEIAPGKAVNLYEEVIAGVAPYDFRAVGTGLARVDAKSTVATRLANASGPLLVFRDPEPNFLRALRSKREGADFVFAYAAVNRADCGVDVLVARVSPDRIAERKAYRFWAGSYWVDDLSLARPALERIAGGIGQVAWNDYLQRYVSAFSDLCTGGTKLHVRSAPRPQGPWSAAAIVDLAPVGATAESYAGMLQPALGTGREMMLTFYRPEKDGTGKLRMVRLRFR
jgi:Domain of unknown function (DUF4185)